MTLKYLVYAILALVALGIIAAVLFVLMIFSTSWGYDHVNKKLSNQFYFKDGDVYFCRMGNFFELGAQKIEGADKETFEVIDEYLAKDKNTIYYQKLLTSVSRLLHGFVKVLNGKFLLNYYR